MSVMYKCGGEICWSFSNNISRRFEAIVTAVATDLSVDSGISWLPYDEANVDPDQFERFARALLTEWERRTNAMYRALMTDLLLVVLVLGRRAGIVIEFEDPVLVGQIDATERLVGRW